MSAGVAVTRAAPVARTLHAWTTTLVVLGLGLLALGLLFREEAAAAVRVWETSTAYNHCWLILPIAGWLAWVRRDRLAGRRPVPAPWLALAALPLAIGWLLAERLGIMEGRQLAAIGIVQVLLVVVLGVGIARAMAAPILYLVFLVPFGAFAVPLLQQATLWVILVGLRVLGIPHYADGLVIDTVAGAFHVAEACAGLRFIVAALAFGALYAFTMFRSLGRRLAVMAMALVVPVVANGIRALGIVVLAQHLGSAEAAAADHLLYGWIFFSVVILLLVLAGLPFREDGGVPTAAPPAPGPRLAGPPMAFSVAAAGLTLLLAATGPAVAMRVGRAGTIATRAPAPMLAATEECVARPGEPGMLHCPDARVVAELVVFPGGVTWSVVAAERLRLSGSDDEAVVSEVSSPAGVRWQLRQDRARPGPVAVAAWLGGAAASDGLGTRARQALNSLRGGDGRPVVVAVELRPDTGRTGGAATMAADRALLGRVLAAQDAGLSTAAAELSLHPR